MKFLPLLAASVLSDENQPSHRQTYEIKHNELIPVSTWKSHTSIEELPFGQRNHDEERDGKIVVWKRCEIDGGTVYKKRGGQVLHPTPVILRCLPGYELRKGNDKYERNNIVCKAGVLNYHNGARNFSPADDLKCVRLPKADTPKWKEGCPKPVNDLKFTVVDSFRRPGAHGKFGFVFEVSVPARLENDYSVVLEYPEGARRANLQTWNLAYFGFYEKYVLFHAGTIQVDGDDKRKSVIVIEGLDGIPGENKAIKPKLYLFDKTIKNHDCFSTATLGRNSNPEWFVKTNKFRNREDVAQVEIDRALGWVMPQQ